MDAVQEREVQTSALQRKQQRQSERFLRGPIPLRAIVAAGALPGQSLLVLLAIQHRVDLTGQPCVSLASGVLAEFGLSRSAKDRALIKLEQAGLVRVRHRPGRATTAELTYRRAAGSVSPVGSGDDEQH